MIYFKVTNRYPLLPLVHASNNNKTDYTKGESTSHFASLPLHRALRTHDESLPFIRSFHSRCPSNDWKYSSNAEHLTLPLAVLNPKDIRLCGPPSQVRWVGSGGWHYAGCNDLPLDV